MSNSYGQEEVSKSHGILYPRPDPSELDPLERLRRIQGDVLSLRELSTRDMRAGVGHNHDLVQDTVIELDRALKKMRDRWR